MSKADVDMVPKEKIYEFLTSQAAIRSDRSIDAFKLFVQMFSAIVGGCIWLSIAQKSAQSARVEYVLLTNVAVAILFVVVTAMVGDNLRSWYSYRKQIAALGTGVGFSKPNMFSSALSEAAMLLGAFVACGLFIAFNPLR